jgi:hypothetical protein
MLLISILFPPLSQSWILENRQTICYDLYAFKVAPGRGKVKPWGSLFDKIQGKQPTKLLWPPLWLKP